MIRRGEYILLLLSFTSKLAVRNGYGPRPATVFGSFDSRLFDVDFLWLGAEPESYRKHLSLAVGH